MDVPFITRPASGNELTKLKYYMSTYTDGSGYEKNPDGTTRPGWRDFERIVAELLGGRAPEGKGIFDIIVNADELGFIKYGVSVKSKGFSKNKFQGLMGSGRVYMELCNSPAKLWEPLKELGINEQDFTAQQYADQIGSSILSTIHSWYLHSGIEGIVLDNSIHMTVSYGPNEQGDMHYQVHTFPLDFPEGIIWRYKSAKCLSGYDPEYPDEVLFDWYGLSGGQVKYYPRASKALYSSHQFALEQAQVLSIAEKAQNYWGVR
ncbi:hypothetical protein AB0539_004149 [Vibrio parahaemolyticus]|uniref:hypothetical protein n=1 Tax=Vibrio parahaemolyticus TaxID=670 RepID=UPI00248A91FA|nr:hypothetical protein [Vibrio parahaemolyticus]